MEEKLISVIVCTYNRTEGLISTLDSVRIQSYKNFELIISDDGSENKVLIEMIEDYLFKYRDVFKYVQFIRHEINVGIVKNMQNAYKNAKGEIIKGISPGDLLYDDDILKRINAFFNEYKPLIACGFPRSYTRQNNKIIDRYVYNYYTYRNLNSINKTIRNMVCGGAYITGATLILHRDLFTKYNFYLPDSIKYTEDIIQTFVSLYNIKIYNLHEFVVWYEWGSGISTSNNKEFYEKIYQDNEVFYQWILDKDDIAKDKLMYIKLRNILNDKNISKTRKCLSLLKSPHFFCYILISRFFRKIINHFIAINIRLQTYSLIRKQGNGFIDLI